MAKFNLTALLKTSDITPDVQSHLVRVYAALFACCLFATGGVLAQINFGIGGILTFLLSFGIIFWLNFHVDKNDLVVRIPVLCLFGFCQGTLIGPLINASFKIDPSIIVIAVSCTVAIFTSFSLAALIAKRRSYLYLGSFLGASLLILCVMGISNLFVQSAQVHMMYLYGGLVVFSGFVVFDTQMIIEKASNGQKDVAGHALELFIDLVQILVRIIAILSKKKGSRGGGGSGSSGVAYGGSSYTEDRAVSFPDRYAGDEL